MSQPDDSGSPARAQDCTVCGGELAPGDDFCRACGHSVSFLAGTPTLVGEPDTNQGDICPNCGATHMVLLSQGYPQCETCGYTERHLV